MKILDQNLKKLIKAGVYNKEDEHDACGVGFVASIDGKSRREVVENGIEALKAVWHRGAVDKDGKTGDGAGIHLELSKDFFEEQIKITGHHTHKNDQLCVGMIFLPRNDYGAQEACRTIVEHEILSNNFYIFGWRQVPVKAKVLGIKANDTRPEIEQILFSPIEKTGSEELEKNIYIIRKKIEKKIAQSQLKDFYISSISSRSIIYKGMFLAEHLSDFYPDLLDKRFISRFSIFHQRYSTNTFPSWELAQPFRILAHNGEINTLKGNINWMKTHEQGLESDLYPNIEDLKPILKSGSSDTACLDAIFELLTRSGRLLPLVKMMLMPEAWSKRSKIIPQAYRDMYNYLNSVIEP
ncbi:MAG: glutamate synthase large subunit, partial [Proteobacteria bacterium]|nr:glutamate synthase large subunit [Candidatus Fonsibacter sp. PEL4]